MLLIISMVSNIELLLKKEFRKNRELGRAEGRAEGRVEGEKKKVLEIAKKFLVDGVDIGIIAKSTGLSEDELRKIKDEIN
jgi:predicted transposase/invertase (TIGR01784 family)